MEQTVRGPESGPEDAEGDQQDRDVELVFGDDASGTDDILSKVRSGAYEADVASETASTGYDDALDQDVLRSLGEDAAQEEGEDEDLLDADEGCLFDDDAADDDDYDSDFAVDHDLYAGLPSCDLDVLNSMNSL
jgi:hypothetical protein